MDLRPQVAIVIPAYNAAGFLKRSLPVTRRVAGHATVLVVDAGSTDSTGEVALALGARVIRLSGRAGPARARNVGAEKVSAEVILFLDADCVPHGDVFKRVSHAFRNEPDLVALSGSYDAASPEPGFFSQYMNLRHHYTHRQARREPATFWAGCGAVRRNVFVEAGGFDAARFPRPQIEDIELGGRLRIFGRTRLDPEMQVTHLKRWTLRSVLRADILDRAIPWTRLVMETGKIPNDLNLCRSQRVAALIAPFALGGACAVPWAAWNGRWDALALAALLIGLSLGLNGGLERLFARQRGLGFAIMAWGFHQFHLFYSLTVFAAYGTWYLGRKLVGRLRRKPSARQPSMFG